MEFYIIYFAGFFKVVQLCSKTHNKLVYDLVRVSLIQENIILFIYWR